MNIDVVSVSSCQKKVSFTVPAASVRSAFDKYYKELRGRVRMNGFRAGKAPRHLLQQRFGARVMADVSSDLIQQGYSEAISAHGIEPVGRPSVDRGEIAENADFSFSITVDVKPEIELGTVEGVEVVYPKSEVSDEQVEAAVAARLNSQARLVEIKDRAVEAGDLVLAELVAKDGDEVVVREAGTMVRTDGDIWYPGLEELLIGTELEAEVSGDVTFGESARNTDVAGKTLSVTAKVISIQHNEVPELSDEVAEELGFEGGAEGMKVALRGQQQEQLDNMSRNQARANLLQALIDANTFDVPEGMVEQQLQALIEELKMQAAYQGRDPRTIRYNDAQLADLRMRARFAVKGALILEWVSKTHELEVNDEDLERKYQEIADERGQAVEAIRGYFHKEGAVDELRDRLLEEKTLDWLMERATLIDPPGPEEAAANEAEADVEGDSSGDAEDADGGEAVGEE